jgi:hypothetical protein
MGTVLSILDIVIVLLVVFTVARAVWTGPSGAPSSPLLAAFVTLALLIFGTVSLCAADGLTTNTFFNQSALFIYLAAIAATTQAAKPNKQSR